MILVSYESLCDNNGRFDDAVAAAGAGATLVRFAIVGDIAFLVNVLPLFYIKKSEFFKNQNQISLSLSLFFYVDGVGFGNGLVAVVGACCCCCCGCDCCG